MSASDNDIMILVRDGDVKKLAVLFDRYHVRLYNFFIKLTGVRGKHYGVCEDLVQDVFYRMLKYRHTFRGEAPFTVWMYQLARNVATDFFRKKQNALTDRFEPDEELSSGLLPSDGIEQEQSYRYLHAALQKLAPEKREVLILSRFQELKYEEIAQIQGVQVGVVKTRVHRALNELRRHYYSLSQEF